MNNHSKELVCVRVINVCASIKGSFGLGHFIKVDLSGVSDWYIYCSKTKPIVGQEISMFLTMYGKWTCLDDRDNVESF